MWLRSETDGYQQFLVPLLQNANSLFSYQVLLFSIYEGTNFIFSHEAAEIATKIGGGF